MAMIKKFLKDQWLDFAGYSCVTLLILFFFYLNYGRSTEVVYPLLLSVFVVIIITLIKGYRFYRFHKALRAEDFNDFLWEGTSNQEKEFIDKLHSVQKQFQQELSALVKEREQSNAFLAQMVHDMKIPISVIRLVLDDMEQEKESAANLEANLLKLKKGSDLVLEKLSQALSYLRMGQFEKDYLIERVNLIDEVRNAVNSKKDYFILNNVYPKFDTKQPAVYILTDRKWHGMLLEQIISNAIKYTAAKESEGYIHFDVKQTDETVELTITDFGVGIPAYDMERIFEPFFTGENGRTVGNSSGIGLYLCRIISEKLKHQLTITSVRGEKTTVTIKYLTKM